VDIVAEHSSSALGNALEHRGIFLLSLWKLLGKSKKLFVDETLPKTLAVIAAVLLLFGVMIFLPWKFQMHTPGTLEPIERARIFSPLDAEITRLLAYHNMRVEGPVRCGDGEILERGTPLLELRSTELENMESQLRGELLGIDQRLLSLNRRLVDQDRSLDAYRRAELVGERDRELIQRNTISRQLEIFEMHEKPKLTITSPIDGVVVTMDLERRLTEKRPISRMQYVMEIANLDGPWHLKLLVPESRMGFIMEQQRSLPPGEYLQVEFILATDPAVKHFGRVAEIHNRAEVRSETGSATGMASGINSVLVKVELDEETMESLSLELRPGAEVSARIHCGERALGYVIFYELIVYFQKHVRFRWF
jgi:hypothetical protein